MGNILRNEKIGIIGCGNMGGAIIAGLSSSGIVNKILAADPDKKKTGFFRAKFKIKIAKSNKELVKKSNVVILAVKPQIVESVLSQVKEGISKTKLIISIAAGITTKYIEQKLSAKTKVVRVMPNTPALIQEGMSLITAGRGVTGTDLKLAQKIFATLGQTGMVKESLFDAVTAISGCGPAYYFYLSEILINLAKKNGINDKLAQKIVKQTVLGSAKLLNISEDNPQVLRSKVTSKGGVTEAAFKILEKKKIKETFRQAILSARKRSKELSHVYCC